MPQLPTLAEQRKLARERFLAGRKAYTQYTRSLLGIARQVDAVVRGFRQGELFPDDAIAKIVHTLTRYSQMLGPWAEATSGRMLADVAGRDRTAWIAHGKTIHRELKREIETTPVGSIMRAAQAEQVTLITSLPLEAAQRVQALALEGFIGGERSAGLAAQILATGEVTKSRAKLIARTETAKVSAILTRTRATHLGCTHFVWHTAKDGRVRESHREMEGKVLAYADGPPLLSDGEKTFPGEIFNCRCFSSPIIPD